MEEGKKGERREERRGGEEGGKERGGGGRGEEGGEEEGKNILVAVPGRNQTLFRCVIRLCYCVQSTVAQNFY